MLFLFLDSLSAQDKSRHDGLFLTPKSDVLMQGFYWNSTPGGIWWDSLARLAPRLASAGFGGIWFPPPEKGASGSYSMGYDPYDHYDFGQYNQKGSVETRFGSRQELINSINAFHAVGMQVFADAVMGHMNGGDIKVPFECEPYPSYPDSAWLVFNYPNGSHRFLKNASYFYPNLQTCDVNPPYHGPSDPIYKFGEVLAHAQSHVRDSLIVWGKYLRQVLGFDGFRIDAVKAIDPIFVGPWLDSANVGGYAFAEYYGSASEIGTWLHYCQNVFGGDVSMLDFPLRFSLQDMCNNTSGSYDMTYLDGAGLISTGISGMDVVTFLENHDLDRIGWDGSIDNGHNPVISDKALGYAYLIFSEGRPCVFFKDYMGYGLASRIDTLIRIREKFLYGGTTKRSGLNPWYVGSAGPQEDQARDIYVARRDGGSGRPQAFLVINDNPSEWRGVWVNSDHPNQVFHDYTGVAIDKQAAGDGRVELWAPPRGYAIYVPDTAGLNHSPYIQTIPDQSAFSNALFTYQIEAGDPNNDPLSFSMTGNPAWLGISTEGVLTGTPLMSDTGSVNVVVRVLDDHGEDMRDTFRITVRAHPVIDGAFEGSSVWGPPVAQADTLPGWDTAMVHDVYMTQDQEFFYLGARVTARQSMNWAFVINSKPGGGTNDSWSRSIQYNHPNRPDYVLRGNFSSYAEFHVWNVLGWAGVGLALATTEFADNIASASPTEGWVEARIHKWKLGTPTVLGVQFFLTGDQNGNATYDACPDDENTTVPTGLTTHLHYYGYLGAPTVTSCNLQFPSGGTITPSDSLTVYARAFGVGLTDSSGAGDSVQAWIGYNTANTNPATWTTWVPAVYNTDVNNSDEYAAAIGHGFSGATYYYASRFQYGEGPFLYGGYSSSGGGIWNGTSYVSGTLVVQAAPAVPVPALPINGDTAISSRPTLLWNASPGAVRYRLEVSVDSLFASTIVSDSTVTTTSTSIGPLEVMTRYFWRLQGINNYGTSAFSDVQSFTTGPFIITSTEVLKSWNMVSIPAEVPDMRKNQLFPSAVSNAFTFAPSQGYEQRDTLARRAGYWLKFGDADTIQIEGVPVVSDTIELLEGWNMIGSITAPVPVASIIEDPPGIIGSDYIAYERGYLEATIIEPGKSYWVKANSAGRIVLSSPVAARAAVPVPRPVQPTDKQ